MNQESIGNINKETEALKEKALLVFDLISRTLYCSLFSPKEEKDG